MRWLLDSNVLIDALAGLPHGIHVLQEARKRPDVSIIYSSVSRIELLGYPHLSLEEETAISRLLKNGGF
jgi:predicted nucleic acid-binding protein